MVLLPDCIIYETLLCTNCLCETASWATASLFHTESIQMQNINEIAKCSYNVIAALNNLKESLNILIKDDNQNSFGDKCLIEKLFISLLEIL